MTERIEEYSFSTGQGEVSLSSLFGDKKDLIVIHFMGKKCPYCALWADGYNGLLHHLEDRAAFAISSPDSPEDIDELCRRKGWKFKMVSSQGSSFTEDMGMKEIVLSGISLPT